MNKKIIISNYQLAIIAVGFFHGSTSISNPAMSAKRDAWISVLLGTIIGILTITLHLFVSKINNGRNLVEITEYCFGKTGGKIVCILYILYFLYLSTYNTRTFGEFMIAVSYPETPMLVLVLILVICASYAARSGLTVIGKTCEILVPLLPMAVVVVTLSLLNTGDFTGFKPILLNIGPVIRSAFDISCGIYGDFVIFLMILPYTNSIKGRFKSTFWAVGITFAIIMTITARNIQIIGPVLTDYIRYPSHVAAQLIPGISIDPLVDMNLLIGGGVKVAVCIYACSKMTSEISGIDQYRPLVSSYAMLTIALGFWIFPNAMDLYRWLKSFGDTVLSLPVQILFPVLMLIITKIKNKKNKRTVKRTPPELIIG